MDKFILPILSFIIALVTVFVDHKNPKRKTVLVILIIALLVSCTWQIYSNFRENVKKQEMVNALNQDIDWGKNQINNLTIALANFRDDATARFDEIISLELKTDARLSAIAGALTIGDTDAQPELKRTLLLVDVSSSMRRFEALVNQTINELVKSQTIEGDIGLMSFHSISYTLLPFGQDNNTILEHLLFNKSQMKDALYRKLSLKTDIRTAVEKAIGALNRIPSFSRKIILFTDGINDPLNRIPYKFLPDPLKDDKLSLQFDELGDIELDVYNFGSHYNIQQVKRIFPQAKTIKIVPAK